MSIWWIVLIALLVGLAAAARRVLGANDRLDTSWVDALLKAAAIVVASIVLLVVVPDWILRRQAVAELSGPAQDLVGVGAWLGGLVIVLTGLRYAHRGSRV